MEERNERKMAGRPRNGRALTTAKPTAVGVIVPVTDPPDLWYLCEKARYARRFPYIRSDGERAMYQRRVSTWVRLDNENFAYRFPYCGEVGFNMSHRPPSPVMSKDEPFRPSTFPLSKYSLMKNRLLDGVSALLVEVDLLDKVELENVLSWTLEEDGKKVEVDPRIVRILKGGKVKGLLRIPDVLRLKVYDNPGEAQYSQANLKSVIEMKFPGDVLSPAQQEAYEIIAGPAGLGVQHTYQWEDFQHVEYEVAMTYQGLDLARPRGNPSWRSGYSNLNWYTYINSAWMSKLGTQDALLAKLDDIRIGVQYLPKGTLLRAGDWPALWKVGFNEKPEHYVRGNELIKSLRVEDIGALHYGSIAGETRMTQLISNAWLRRFDLPPGKALPTTPLRYRYVSAAEREQVANRKRTLDDFLATSNTKLPGS
ncbi:type VI immunity family protein [Pseudomonas monteilii]|uniref:type VI immunity family protein n=1 Tax=Pseudomonas monteilii TaxID=76759 RepID=UPI00383BC6D1